MSLMYEWIDENQYINQYIPYNNKNGKVNVYVYDNTKNDYNYKFCYYIPISSVPVNAILKSCEEEQVQQQQVQQQQQNQQQQNQQQQVQQQNQQQQVQQQQVQQQQQNQQQQVQYINQGATYSFTLADGSQIMLDQIQTISYLYNVGSQALQKIALLEKSLADEINKSTTLSQQLETQKQLSNELYKVNQNLSNEYYKLQQQQLMKAEHNNLNRKINYLNKKNNENNNLTQQKSIDIQQNNKKKIKIKKFKIKKLKMM
jgi:hypothetical protein